MITKAQRIAHLRRKVETAQAAFDAVRREYKHATACGMERPDIELAYADLLHAKEWLRSTRAGAAYDVLGVNAKLVKFAKEVAQ